VLPRETGEVQLAIVGKRDKPRNVLLPAELATALAEIRGEPQARVFPITERRINYIVKATLTRCAASRNATSQPVHTACSGRRSSSSTQRAIATRARAVAVSEVFELVAPSTSQGAIRGIRSGLSFSAYDSQPAREGNPER
jgi:hypothetical protein